MKSFLEQELEKRNEGKIVNINDVKYIKFDEYCDVFENTIYYKVIIDFLIKNYIKNDVEIPAENLANHLINQRGSKFIYKGDTLKLKYCNSNINE